jgi:N-acetylglucosaminyldiphosphoundecaprenol N-acetyl-beta-D-mannosaminyltransferase
MKKILDIDIEFNRDTILSMSNHLINNKQKGYIFTINSNLLVNAYKRNGYREILKNSTINICDGSLLTATLNVLNREKNISYPGPDFFIDRIKEKRFKHLFLGSTQEVLENLKSQLVLIDTSIENSKFVELPFHNVDDFDYAAIGNDINQSAPDFIWVSLGAPKQEEFSSILIKHINQGLIVSVGAAFDFYSGLDHIKRSPLFLRKLNLEWLWRVYKQPSKTLKRLKAELFYMPIILFKAILRS